MSQPLLATIPEYDRLYAEVLGQMPRGILSKTAARQWLRGFRMHWVRLS
jgi:hypothetical protein